MPAGRPTDYRPEHVSRLENFLEQYEATYDSPVTKTSKDGEVTEYMVEKANPPITIKKIANHFGVTRSTIYLWAQTHPEFSDILKKKVDYNKEIVVENAIMGRYSQAYSIFLSKNEFGMTDKQEVKHDVSDETKNLLEKLGDAWS